MKTEEILFLSQLIDSLEKAEEQIEKAYQNRDSLTFDKAKKDFIQIQKEISNYLI